MQVSVAFMNQVSFRELKASYPLDQIDSMSCNPFVMYYITKVYNRGQDPSCSVPGMILDPCVEVFFLFIGTICHRLISHSDFKFSRNHHV